MASSEKRTTFGVDLNKYTDPKGAFVRPPSSFRNWIGGEGSDFKAERDRYHLYVSLACPWAHRTVITRKLKGLEDVITLDVVDWYLGKEGWRFNPEVQDATPDTVNGYKRLRELYQQCNPDYDGRVTVPVLYDKKRKQIVNNESSEIIRMLNTGFNEFCPTPEQKAIDLYPFDIKDAIDEVNTWVYK